MLNDLVFVRKGWSCPVLWDGPWNASYTEINLLQLFAEWNLVVEALLECLKNSTQQNGIDKAEIVLYLIKPAKYISLQQQFCRVISSILGWQKQVSSDSFKASS